MHIPSESQRVTPDARGSARVPHFVSVLAMAFAFVWLSGPTPAIAFVSYSGPTPTVAPVGPLMDSGEDRFQSHVFPQRQNHYLNNEVFHAAFLGHCGLGRQCYMGCLPA